jgi:hypothetical protein
VASECAAESAGCSYRLHGTHMCQGIAAGSDGTWQRLTVSRVDDFIRDLKDAVWDAKGCPEGKGNMVTLYGTCNMVPRTDLHSDNHRFGQFECYWSRDGWGYCHCIPGCVVQGLMLSSYYPKFNLASETYLITGKKRLRAILTRRTRNGVRDTGLDVMRR